MEEIILEVWGDFACFTAPYGKVERITYPFPTPSAARGILCSIYNKPIEFRWQINRIEVLRPIRYISFKCNEVKKKASSNNPMPIGTEDDDGRTQRQTVRTQRQTVALRDVHYRIAASIIPRPAFAGKKTAFYAQARRRMAEGKCFLQPSLGLRQFVCYFELYDPARHTDQPIPEDLDAGLMVYDLFDPYDGSVQKKTQTQLALFHAVMRQGVVQVPPYESPEVFKGGSGAC